MPELIQNPPKSWVVIWTAPYYESEMRVIPLHEGKDFFNEDWGFDLYDITKILVMSTGDTYTCPQGPIIIKV